MPLVSVIVAVYQSEKFLRRCVDSILNQSLQDIEVLLVDDGSSDKSAKICKEYVQKDLRIRFFLKKHSGVSDTRQKGLESATGDYVIHCDSDDWMEPNMLETLYEKAKKCDVDMVVCNYWAEYRKRVVHNVFGQSFDSSIDLKEQMHNLSSHVWNKMIRRSFIENNKLHFLPFICYAEDLYFVFRTLDLTPNIAYVPLPLYHYNVQNEDSMTHNVSRECFESQITVLTNLSTCINVGLNKKLEWYKCSFLYHAYKSKYYTVQDLLCIFPEVHKLILPLSIKHYGGNMIFRLKKWYRRIVRGTEG